jgi:hypothetical protein
MSSSFPPLVPANVGIQIKGLRAGDFSANSAFVIWIPAFAGTSGQVLQTVSHSSG